MKIILVGPFPPLRGGISMFNHSLANELEKNHEVHRISFSLQYPKLLFPGKTQYFNFEGKPSKALINSINPFSWTKTANYIKKLSPDIIVFQYWIPFFAPAFNSIAKQVKKDCNVKIIVNCNNIKSHEPKPAEDIMTKSFFKNCDSFMVMSSAVEHDLKLLINNPNYKKSPHPIYEVFGEKVPKDIARNNLNLGNEKIILHFGLIRDYKGLDILIKAAKTIKNKIDNFKILVVGECYENEEKYINLVNKLNLKDIFDFRFEFIPNEKVNNYFCASDLVVLPYRSATQSGIVPIAYHFDKPVVVSNVGGLPEVVLTGKSGFICEPNSEDLSKTIINFFENNQTMFSEFISTFKKEFSWHTFTKNLLELTKHD